MEFIGLYELVGKFTGTSDYKGKGKNFPLIYIHFIRGVDKELVKLLADKDRWNKQGGDDLKPTYDTVFISYGEYSTMVEGKEIILHVFEDILEVS